MPVAATEKALDLHAWIVQRVDELALPDGHRARLATSCHELTIDLLRGIALMVQAGLTNAAYVLLRSQVRSFVQGVWLRYCASDPELDLYVKDKLELSLARMLEDIEQVDGFHDGVLFRLKRDALRVVRQRFRGDRLIGSRHTGVEAVEPSRQELADLLSLAGGFGVYACLQLAIEASRLDIADEALTRLTPEPDEFPLPRAMATDTRH